jgi:PhnB protein
MKKLTLNPLAVGGQITMELQDMFWGSYSGKINDRFGVQWMSNCIVE